MKFIIFGLALIACVVADVSELGYDYHAPAATQHHEVEAPKNTYIPPAASAPAPISAPAPAPSNTYIPPPQPQASAPEPVNTYIPPAPAASDQTAVLADDGYRYKTVRRRVYRRRF